MYLSKVTLKNPPKLFAFLNKKSGTDGYASHQLLWSLFPNDGSKKRDFLFYKNDKSSLPDFLLVSKDEPKENDILLVYSKEYNPQLVVGQKLIFSLVANPVVARKAEGKKNSIKHDVWMDAKKQALKRGLSGGNLRKFCEGLSKDWLISQGKKCGFELLLSEIVIDGYQQNRIYKGRKKTNKICFSSIAYRGRLRVSDTEKFVKMLGDGLGKSKAFGCGMMLVKRA